MNFGTFSSIAIQNVVFRLFSTDCHINNDIVDCWAMQYFGCVNISVYYLHPKCYLRQQPRSSVFTKPWKPHNWLLCYLINYTIIVDWDQYTNIGETIKSIFPLKQSDQRHVTELHIQKGIILKECYVQWDNFLC